MDGFATISEDQASRLEQAKTVIDQAESINRQTLGAAQEARLVAASIGQQADKLVTTLHDYLTPPGRMEWSEFAALEDVAATAAPARVAGGAQ